jgi:Restriction endonuclease
MKHEWLTLEVYLARPGADRDLLHSGVRAVAAVDTAAEVTVVPEELVQLVYGTDVSPVESVVRVAGIAGTLEMKRVPLLIGLSTGAHDPAHAQVSCLVGPMKRLILGSDVLSLLGLELRVDYHQKRVHLERYTWERFEDEVATIYRSLGAFVKQNLNLGGFQVDLVAEEATQSGQKLRLLIECKFYRDSVGNRVVNDFARVVATLKSSGHIDRGVIVSHRGFTQDASLVAANTGVELLTLDDLRQRASNTAKRTPGPRERELEAPSTRSAGSVRRFFVVMPFAPDLDDVYHFGIRETIHTLGGACERADEIQHTGGILEKIYDSIRDASIIIAEVSFPNPNVFYEIGFAHALGKPVVLLTRDISNSPFDLRGYNHIVYKSIVELRKGLDAMLRQLLR